MADATHTPLHEAARSRYLNYALSVITSRALPDIRDGLKPVQRRILYTMFASLRLYPDGRYRKCATIVGDTMGKYHPHGDGAIYDAMARMAQTFSLRDPLVDGHGNFGSIDGDRPAAMRYTEAKLRPLAMTLLEELRQDTVAFRPNFDGTLSEPVVLPSRAPNLLVNGATGIAVGMATSIPPHNLGEVLDASVKLLKSRLKGGRDGWPEDAIESLVGPCIKGPDFPTGGCILNSEKQLLKIYRKGEGMIQLRGEYSVEKKSRIVIRSIPYGVNKSELVEKIAGHISADRVPQLTDIRDESTDDVRVVLELKRKASAEAAMAYLFKHTALEQRFHVNLTCLLPTENPQVSVPRRVNVQQALEHFLEFRLEVVTRRLRHELAQLEKRIHILEGFTILYDALDEAIKIIRSSRNRADSGQRLRHRFQLSEAQSDAVLDTRLYKLSQLEISAIRDELGQKRARASEIHQLLDDAPARWDMVRDELQEVKARFATPRRTAIVGPDAAAYEYSPEDYIVSEDTTVIVTRGGWIKRQASYADLSSIRVREGDTPGWVMASSTRATTVIWTNFGRAYTVLSNDIKSSTGYGGPIQALFDWSNKEQVVGVTSCDSRVLGNAVPGEGDVLVAPMGYVVAIVRTGRVIRLPLAQFAETSNRKGRAYMNLKGDDEVIGAWHATGTEHLCVASQNGRVLIFPVAEIPLRAKAAMGVIGMRLEDGDAVLAAALSRQAREGLSVITGRGRKDIVRPTKYKPAKRGSKGRVIIGGGAGLKSVWEPTVVDLP